MKNIEQLIKDLRDNEELRGKFHEALNKLRSDGALTIKEATIKVAREMGYDISDEEVMNLINRMQNRKGTGKAQLSDDELENVAGGYTDCECYYMHEDW